jgi:beta-barrel assembly-enhancing protease
MSSSFGLIGDKSINAFSLPGGPVYVNTGLIAAAQNEGQLAGVLAHEMSHVTLRHATNQMSKQNLIQLPALLAENIAGDGMLGKLAQMGIGLGANSILLKFSRTDEAQADYNGALMAHEAGYNPIEMARFFQQLEAQVGKGTALTQFLSDHPNPGNRVEAVDAEVKQLPARQFTTDTGRFPHIKDVVAHLPARTGPPPSSQADNNPSDTPARFR